MGTGYSAHLGVELIKATADGNLFEVRRLLRQGASPNYRFASTCIFLSVDVLATLIKVMNRLQ